MKRLGVFPLPPEWDASPSQGYPPSIKFAGIHLATETQCPRPGLEPGPLDPESSSITIRPPRLPPPGRMLRGNLQWTIASPQWGSNIPNTSIL